MTDKVVHINSSAELDALFAKSTYVVVDFFADWCPPCRQIAPIFTQLAAKHSMDGWLSFAKVNVDHVGDVAQKFGVTAMPTFMFFKDGVRKSVNGQRMIQGADPRALGAAVEFASGLATKRSAEAAAQA